MTTTDGDGRPSFREVAEAMTPPGAKWDEWKAAMRQAHVTGGHQPGRQAPDISLGGAPAEILKQAMQQDGGLVRSVYEGEWVPDPFASMTPGAVAATAMHEAFTDLVAGGFTEDQALTFLARAYAAANGTPGG